MDNHSQETGNIAECVWGFVAGLLVGSLTGAAVMLFLAPQSGKKTRDQMVKTVEDGVARARGTARQITGDVLEQAEELEQHGQDMLDEQRDHLSKTLKGWGKAVRA